MNRPSNWKPKKLDELGFVGRGKSRHRPRNAPELYGGEFPFIQTANIMASNLYINTYSQTYSELGLAQSKMWEKGTLCMTIAGENTAETAILGFDACFPDSVIGFLADPNLSDVRFVKYYLDTIKSNIKAVTKGATQDNLSLDKLLSFDLFVPDVLTQRRIADILSAYDDLIENNSRRIDLLRQSARMLYKEWFVSLRFPGHEHVKVKDGAPQGWEFRPLSEIVDIKKGKSITKETVEEGSVPVVAGGLEPAYFHSTVNAKGPTITISASGANAGYANLYFQDIWASDCSYISAEWTENIYYFYCLIKQRQTELFALQKGAAQPHVYPKDLGRINVLHPPEGLIRDFTEISKSTFELMENLEAQNRQLHIARDLLLPRLMNGEIPV